jgi:hypothetical protein
MHDAEIEFVAYTGYEVVRAIVEGRGDYTLPSWRKVSADTREKCIGKVRLFLQNRFTTTQDMTVGWDMTCAAAFRGAVRALIDAHENNIDPVTPEVTNAG